MVTLLRVFAVVCTLMCAGQIALLFRSIYVADLIRYRTDRGTYVEIATIPSQIRISRASSWPDAQSLAWTHGSYQTLSKVGAVGYHLMRWQAGPVVDTQSWRVGAPAGVSRVNVSTIALPLPLLIGITAIPALIAWIGWKIAAKRRRHRLDHGLCIACGYDLRAAIDRCPECGRALQAAG